MSRIPDHVVEDVRAAADIVQTISDYVALKKKGKYYTGLCPFHSEDTPSFTVTPDKQIFYCFGCNAGGNVFKFIMLKENLSFPEAVRLLAKRLGIIVPEQQEQRIVSKAQQALEKAYKANHQAMEYWHYFLTKHQTGESARKYLANRQISNPTIEQFKLGYALSGWDRLCNFLSKKGYQPVELEKYGLVLARENSDQFYDRFRQRVMFPIWDHHGRVVGFGGRVLDNSVPKYLNSPETDLFSKSNVLYGLNFAAKAIREQDQVIIMEGYLDVIRAHQHGINNAVASLGTAMTQEHGKLLMRYTKDVVIAFDSDAAGVRAAMRGLEILQELGFRVRVLTIPDGKDPDEYISKNGPEAFRNLINNQSRSLILFKLNQSIKRYDITTLKGKLGAFEEILPNLSRVTNQVEQEEYLRVIGTELNISWEAILGELNKYTAKQRKMTNHADKFDKNRHNTYMSAAPTQQKTSGVTETALERAETTLARLMVENPGLVTRVIERLGLDFFRDEGLSKLLALIKQLYDIKGHYQPDQLYNYIEDSSMAAILGELLTRDIPTDNVEQQLADCLNVLENAITEDKRSVLIKAIAEAEKAGDFDKVIELTTEYKKLL